MPLAPTFNYFLYQLPAAAEQYIWPIFYVFATAAAFALAHKLATAWAGTLAAAATAYALSSVRFRTQLCTTEQMLYSAACFLVVYALIRRSARQRSVITQALTGACIGLSLFIKSPLFLLPFALAAWDIFSGKLRRGETSWQGLALLCLVPYVMLLPWLNFGSATANRVLFFEHGRAAQNMITAALGIACAIEGGRALAALPPSSNYFLWAIKTALQHPINFLSGLLSRPLLLLEWYPLALTALWLGWLRCRQNRVFNALIFFLAYYGAIHCLLSIQERYFVPVWPLAIAGAATLPFQPRTKEGAAPVLGKYLFITTAVLLGTLYIATSVLLYTYPSRAKNNKYNLENPTATSAPMLAILSHQALSEGESVKAEKLARSAMMQRRTNMANVAYLYVLASKGLDISKPLLNQPLPFKNPQERREASYLLLANALMQKKPIARELRQGWLDWRLADSSFRRVLSLEESRLQKMLLEENPDFLERELPALLLRFPPKQRPQLLERLKENGIYSVELNQLFLDAVVKQSVIVESKPTLTVKNKKQSVRPSSEQERLKFIYAAIDRHWKKQPLSTASLAELYDELKGLGLEAANLKQFSSALRGNPQVDPRFKKLERLHESHRYAELVKPAQEYLRDYPRDEVATLYLAVALLNINDYTEAKKCLDKAELLPLEPHEVKWLLALRNNLNKELRRRHLKTAE